MSDEFNFGQKSVQKWNRPKISAPKYLQYSIMFEVAPKPLVSFMERTQSNSLFCRREFMCPKFLSESCLKWDKKSPKIKRPK